VKPDTEFELLVQAGSLPLRPSVRLQNQTIAALAICVDAIRFEIWRPDGSSYSGGGDFPQGVGGNRCSVDANWSVVPSSRSWSTVLELPSAPALQAADELLVNGFIWVGPRAGDMGDAKLKWYRWRGTLGKLK
jgi:hypothetical protein